MARKKASPDKKPSQDSMLPSEPEHYPASSLMLADIVMRMGTSVLRKGVEKTFLRGQYGKETAKELSSKRSMGRTLASTAIAKVGTKSIPGAALVGTGLVVKALFDRSAARRDARKQARHAKLTDQSSE